MKRFTIHYPPGLCAMAVLSLAFNTSYEEILVLIGALTKRPRSGLSFNQLKRAIDYASYIYEKRARVFYWRGKLSNFITQYPNGRYIINCSGHVTFVSDGIVFDKRSEDYEVYSAWKISENKLCRIMISQNNLKKNN